MKRGLIILLAFLLAGCLPRPQPPYLGPWLYTDLRALDEISPTSAPPAQDLIAVYTRQAGDELQFRLDLLDLAPQADADIYLALDTAPGGEPALPDGASTEIDWDTLVLLPASGPIQALAPGGDQRPGLGVRALRDPADDTVTISLRRSSLPGVGPGYRFQVLLTPPGSTSPVDASQPLASNSLPPGKVRVFLAFWNTLPATTPAQALRRWDGAHTGPAGGRHGLHNLLRAARSHRVPLFLLDLKNPASLSALDFLGGLPLVRTMAAEGLLVLPDSNLLATVRTPQSLPGWVSAQSALESRNQAHALGLPDSPFLYSPFIQAAGPDLAQYSLVIAPSGQFPGSEAGVTQIYRWRAQRVLPIPDQVEPGVAQPGPEPPIELRRALAAAGQRNSPGVAPSLLLLGGSLPESAWGDPRFARLALDWIAAHPWIRPLGTQDLLALEPAGEYIPDGDHATGPGGSELDETSAEVFQRLAAAELAIPASPLVQAAWQALLALYAPTWPNPAELAELRRTYAGQVNALLEAAGWAANPTPRLDCDRDIDLDGQPECTLASTDALAFFEPDSGALTYLFACLPAETQASATKAAPGGGKAGCQADVHQVIGPSSQLAVGQSDPARWDLSAGLAADPAVIPGAISGGAGPYEVSGSGGRLTFTSRVSGVTKTFSTLPAGLRADLSTRQPLDIQVPVLFDPWDRFQPGWGEIYHGESDANVWTWSLADGLQVQVTASRHLSANSFLDSRALLMGVEDPNIDFPAGHYLPFPLSLVEIQGQGDFSIEIRLLK